MEPDGCCRIRSLDGWTGWVALEHLGQSRLPPAAGTTSAGMILAAVTVYIIEREFKKASVWCLAAAGLSATGLMHGVQWTPADTVGALGPQWEFVVAYAAMGVLLAAAPFITTRSEAEH